MPDGSSIVALLGNSSHSQEVQDLLRQLGAKPPKLKKGAVEAFVVVDARGLELTFYDESYLSKRADLAIGEGKLLLTTARFKAAEPPKVSAFAEPLPYGLAFTQSQAEVERLLGKPEWANPDPQIRRDRWSIDGRHILIRYTDDLSGLEMVTATVPRTKK